MANDQQELTTRVRHAWLGRISGCMLGKAVEILSLREGQPALARYLDERGDLPLRDYIGFDASMRVERACCRGHIDRAVPDDDINYTMLALLMLEAHGRELSTEHVARTWLRLLPPGMTYTAERAAYRVLMTRAAERFADGANPTFDLEECSANPYNEWIGAQIRADLYGWVCPGQPGLAADLARRDAALSHRAAGVHGAMFVAALGAALADDPLPCALQTALAMLPGDSAAVAAVQLGARLAGEPDGGAQIRAHYAELSPVHTLNNLALVMWALCSHADDFSAAVGEVVAAGLDTDCNGATVGGLIGIAGQRIPEQWSVPWRGRVGLSLAGHNEIGIDELVARTVAVAGRMR
jgi:ADP-ribosylglycohydrolase